MEHFVLILSIIGSLASIVGTIFALNAWVTAKRLDEKTELQYQKDNKRVNVKLHYGSEYIPLPVNIRRGDLSRAEILGRIGMIPMKEKGIRFSLGYLSTPDFLDRINKILESSDDDVLSIPCNESEFNQFDLPA